MAFPFVQRPNTLVRLEGPPRESTAAFDKASRGRGGCAQFLLFRSAISPMKDLPGLFSASEVPNSLESGSVPFYVPEGSEHAAVALAIRLSRRRPNAALRSEER